MAMIKKSLSYLVTIGFFVAIVMSVHIKQKTIMKKNARPIVSFHSQWQDMGKPVYVRKMSPLVINNAIKMTISCLDNQMFFAYVSKDLFEKIQENSLVFFDVGDQQITGKIKSLNTILDSNTGLYKVEGLLMGNFKIESANYIADIYEKQEQTVLSLPQEAIEGSDEKHFVWVVHNNQCIKRVVAVQEQKGENIIISSGLDKGDFVVIKGGKQLKDNDKVHILNVEEIQ